MCLLASRLTSLLDAVGARSSAWGKNTEGRIAAPGVYQKCLLSFRASWSPSNWITVTITTSGTIAAHTP